MYKDKDKQREAVKLATRRYRAKGITQKVSHNKGITGESVTVSQESLQQPSPLRQVDSFTTADVIIDDKPKPVKAQSHNPMMIGYVPPRD